MRSEAPGGEPLPLISVVVPVYNVEPYLEECVDSILAQTHANIEVVLVDDGSTDGCPEICDRYAEAHSRVKVLHRPNGGLSAARNSGVLLADGDYIGFIDSDDYVSPVFFEALLDAIADSGCSMAAMRHGVEFFNGGKVELCLELSAARSYEVLSSREYQEEILYQKSWAGAVWRLYSRELCEKVTFPEGFYYEDDDTAYRYAHECERIAVLRATNLYAYRQNPSSIMRGPFNPRKADSALSITRQMRFDMERWYPELSNATCSRCFAILRVVFSQVPSSEEAIQRSLFDEMRRYAPVVLSDPKARKREKLAAAVSMLGRIPFRAFCLFYRSVLKAQ